MIKNLLLALFIFLFDYAKAQQTIDLPNQKEYETYLLSRIDSIQQKLYKFALDFKIKAYKNDSMTSVYSRQELMQRGGKDTYIFVQVDPEDPEFGYDSIITILFNPNDLKGLCFVSKNLNSPFETDETTKLTAIGILFQLTIGGMTVNNMPLALFDPNEVQSVLSPQDFEFLKLYYYFCKHGGGNFKHYDTYDEINGNNFNELSDLKTKLIVGDSVQNKLIYSMLNSNDFYTEIWNNETKKILFDEQENSFISVKEFKNNYRNSMSTNYFKIIPKDVYITIDTIIFIPISFNLPSHIMFNNEYLLEKVKYTFKKEEIKEVKSLKTKDEYTFTIAKKDLIESGFQPIMLWFYEDYCRWLNK